MHIPHDLQPCKLGNKIPPDVSNNKNFDEAKRIIDDAGKTRTTLRRKLSFRTKWSTHLKTEIRMMGQWIS